jgi:predicted nucleotide-binding protein
VEKTVLYPQAKFTVEALQEAEEVLGGQLDRSSLTVASTAHESWQFDDADEFFAQYRSPCVRATFSRSRDAGKAMTVHYVDGMHSSVAVAAPTRGIIEATIAVFEKHRVACTPVSAPPAPAPLPPAPRIFIGHGRAEDWRDLKDHLHEQHRYAVDAYETGARAGHAIRDVLDAMMKNATFAILVLTAEDEMADGQLRPRENVVHETGLFQGHLGWARAIMLVEIGVEPFSNVAGITQIRYGKGQIRSTFGDVVATLNAEFGPGPFRP